MIHEVLVAIVDTVLQLLHDCSMCKGHMVSASIRHRVYLSFVAII
jgi:tRNA(Arg) A34 adenosine deaminase TadA